jgi:Ni/Co efflux regulator RcnB
MGRGGGVRPVGGWPRLSVEVPMKRLAVVALLLSLALPTALLAGKPKKKDKEADSKVVVVFADDEREVVRGYFAEKHGRGNCPPGLAKKHNGCLPPGHAKKRYNVGRQLPADVILVEPSVELTGRLRPCPAGYRYVVVDGDLVKLAVGTMLVVDAIQGLVE